MPFTVITMKNVPASLRGDLSKWMQEIATGVYVGNFNSKIREEIWQRVIENVGNGEATISYSYRNEIGYHFETFNTNRNIVDYDGIPLVQIPMKRTEISDQPKYGFSQAAKNHQSRKAQIKKKFNQDIVVFDIETTGLDEKLDNIIEIAAVKLTEKNRVGFHRLIKLEADVPIKIIELTGITDDILQKEGVEIGEAIKDFKSFIGDSLLIGYNLSFDLKFINYYLKSIEELVLNNRTQDLMKLIKKDNMFLSNYKLETVINNYGIMEEVSHRAKDDVRLYLKLMSKLNKFAYLKIEDVDLKGIF
ncbi:type I-E CRISPR-associated endoribonuclease Cas2e [Hutsoniella sourekii]